MPYRRRKTTTEELWEYFLCVLGVFGAIWLINLLLSMAFGLHF